MGEKYGSIRVPGEVDSAEFEMILDAAVEAGMDTHILEEWYCRDENSVPPAYYLKPKAQMLKNYQNSVSLASFDKKNCAFATNLKIIFPLHYFCLRGGVCVWGGAEINIPHVNFQCPLSELSSLYPLSSSDGVKQRSQDKE